MADQAKIMDLSQRLIRHRRQCTTIRTGLGDLVKQVEGLNPEDPKTAPAALKSIVVIAQSLRKIVEIEADVLDMVFDMVKASGGRGDKSLFGDIFGDSFF